MTFGDFWWLLVTFGDYWPVSSSTATTSLPRRKRGSAVSTSWDFRFSLWWIQDKEGKKRALFPPWDCKPQFTRSQKKKKQKISFSAFKDYKHGLCESKTKNKEISVSSNAKDYLMFLGQNKKKSCHAPPHVFFGTVRLTLWGILRWTSSQTCDVTWLWIDVSREWIVNGWNHFGMNCK